MKIKIKKSEVYACDGRFLAKTGELIDCFYETIGTDEKGNEYQVIWKDGKAYEERPDIIINKKTGEYVTEEIEIERDALNSAISGEFITRV